jgi:RNA polymerase sigma factor (sigma-70 family)
MTGSLDFEDLVSLHYAGLYRFALSLTRDESEAGDLTQQTFYIWAAKGHQLQDRTKVKSWLYTTLHREFLGAQRRHSRFPHYELTEVSNELPNVDPTLVNQLDAQALLGCLGRMDPLFRAPVALFYLEDYAYKEIAGILDIPLGTVKSRIARGIAQLQQLMAQCVPSGGAARAAREPKNP